MDTRSDKTIVKELAEKWLETANEPIMAQRKKLWSDLHSLKPAQPMILIEPGSIKGYVSEKELLCKGGFFRAIERHMREQIRHATEIGDDMVMESYYRMGWEVTASGFGVDIDQIKSNDESSIGYDFNYPIKSPEDMEKLKKREFKIDLKQTMAYKDMLEDAFGGVLPVKLGNHSFMSEGAGNYSWVGNFFFGLTWQIHRFIGQGNMLFWYYDHPDAIHRLMDYMVQDRMAMFRLLEEQNCLTANTDSQMAGPQCYGYCEDLPPCGGGPAKLTELWAWAESQETTGISLSMYKEFVLPYLAKMAKEFGLIYYGCCEQVDDKLEAITEEITNIRCFSVSPWNHFDVVGEAIGNKYVYSRKPAAAYISGASPDWDALKNDLEKTKKSAKGNLEILFRDILDINDDRPRLGKWVDTAKSVFGR